MADLPADRVTAGKPPFTNVGVDCLGPFFVKNGRQKGTVFCLRASPYEQCTLKW